MSETLCETVSVEAIIALLSERLIVLMTGAPGIAFITTSPLYLITDLIGTQPKRIQE